MHITDILRTDLQIDVHVLCWNPLLNTRIFMIYTVWDDKQAINSKQQSMMSVPKNQLVKRQGMLLH